MYLLGVSLARRRFAAERRTPAKGFTSRAANSRRMKQTTLTIAALFVAFTIAALIVVTAITMGAVAGA